MNNITIGLILIGLGLFSLFTARIKGKRDNEVSEALNDASDISGYISFIGFVALGLIVLFDLTDYFF